MTQIQLTTREAVEIALGETAAQCGEFDAGCVRCQAVRLLCDLYGFKLYEFFSNTPDTKRASELSAAFHGFDGAEVSGKF